MVKIKGVVTGLIREPVEFGLSLSRALALRDAGTLDDIILATWRGQLDGKHDLADRLASYGITVTETDEPIASWGNGIRQKKSLYETVRTLAPSDWVLRLRTDKIAEFFDRPQVDEVLGRVRAGDLGHVTPCDAYPPRFRHPVWIWGASTTLPFYVRDQLFLGAQPDVLAIARPALEFDTECAVDAIAGEERWFAAPFMDVPAISDWFHRIRPIEGSKLLRLAALGRVAAVPQFLTRVQLLWLDILRSHFRFFDRYDVHGTTLQAILDGSAPGAADGSVRMDLYADGALDAAFAALGEEDRLVGHLPPVAAMLHTATLADAVSPAELDEVDAAVAASAIPDVRFARLTVRRPSVAPGSVAAASREEWLQRLVSAEDAGLTPAIYGDLLDRLYADGYDYCRALEEVVDAALARGEDVDRLRPLLVRLTGLLRGRYAALLASLLANDPAWPANIADYEKVALVAVQRDEPAAAWQMLELARHHPRLVSLLIDGLRSAAYFLPEQSRTAPVFATVALFGIGMRPDLALARAQFGIARNAVAAGSIPDDEQLAALAFWLADDRPTRNLYYTYASAIDVADLARTGDISTVGDGWGTDQHIRGAGVFSMRIRFSGTLIALRVVPFDWGGIVTVALDGQEYGFDAYSPAIQLDGGVITFSNLADGEHELLITGSDQRNARTLGSEFLLGGILTEVPLPIATQTHLTPFGPETDEFIVPGIAHRLSPGPNGGFVPAKAMGRSPTAGN